MNRPVAASTRATESDANMPMQEQERAPRRGPDLPLGVVALVALAALVVFMGGLKFISEIFGPMFLAYSLVVAVRPMRLWLADRKVPRWLSTVLVALFLYAILLAIIGSMVVSVLQLVETLPNYSGKFATLYQQTRHLLSDYGLSETDVGDSLLEYLQPSRILSAATTVLSGLSSAGSQLFVLVMVMAFLFIDATIIPGRRSEIASAKPGLGQAYADFSHRTSKYWVVNTVFGAIVAVLDTIALMILGVPLAFTWGVFSFVTNYIPNIGFVIGLIPPALLGLLAGGPATAIWVVVLYSVINFVAQSVIQPKVTGDAVGLNTTVTFVSLIFWSAIVGPLGAILAVPLTLFFKAMFIDSDPRSRWIGVAFDSRGKPNDLRWSEQLVHEDGRYSLRKTYGPEPGEDAEPPASLTARKRRLKREKHRRLKQQTTQ
ncbi:AI-2E family transporter [Rothia sp. HC945]|uniref:AI-2E family transporter n=1 Tax=Rothia sp. HC945 TaxID=3171170 RepID=UPI002654C737|nr:AI-2E family transporter [Kocuria sp.]MDN5616992.1 AI-2E family transporter [Kocuria sp.]MDN5653591.1 AI-2E family transporter [Kocuria sp.]